jgi:hypothetical protein
VEGLVPAAPCGKAKARQALVGVIELLRFFFKREATDEVGDAVFDGTAGVAEAWLCLCGQLC